MTTNVLEWHACQCACGHITLKLGTIQMELTKEQFADLHKLIDEAMSEFQIAPTDRPLARIHATRH
jgi:hypothetical protein